MASALGWWTCSERHLYRPSGLFLLKRVARSSQHLASISLLDFTRKVAVGRTAWYISIDAKCICHLLSGYCIDSFIFYQSILKKKVFQRCFAFFPTMLYPFCLFCFSFLVLFAKKWFRNAMFCPWTEIAMHPPCLRCPRQANVPEAWKWRWISINL